MPHSTRGGKLTMTAAHQSTATLSSPQMSPTSRDEEHLASALHAALHSLSRTGEYDSAARSSIDSHSPLSGTTREKPHTSLDITVANDQLYLRGTGVDVEPTLLTGNVVLHLTEPTSIKQIILVFRGKARVPANPHDP